ncbi:MAG: hypothetical protein IPH36_19730 [Saprospiraceae bacterium]|nr:hypothetical protein [Saprospiraceae bacterium]
MPAVVVYRRLGELSNGIGDYFEESHLIPFIVKNSSILPDEFNARLLEEIEVFRADQEYVDDIAVLTCKIF